MAVKKVTYQLKHSISLAKFTAKTTTSNIRGSFKTLTHILLAHDYVDDDDLLDLCMENDLLTCNTEGAVYRIYNSSILPA